MSEHEGTLRKLRETIELARNRLVYNGLATLYKGPELTLINYGYIGDEDPAEAVVAALESQDDKNRLQLYYHVASGVPMEGRDVLEIGSGRGRGAHFIATTFAPRFVEAIDLSRKAIDLSRRRFQANNLHYVVGNAQQLAFPDASFDVAVNIESSHWYPNQAAFFGEARRVLRPGGVLLFADFRLSEVVATTEQQINDAGLAIVFKEDITPNVLAALDADNEFKKGLLAKIPAPLRPMVGVFAGMQGSTMYDSFVSGRRVYNNYVLQAPF